MQLQQLPYHTIPQLSVKDIAYVEEDPRLRSFYRYEVSLEAFEQVIRDRDKFPFYRQELRDFLQKQYEDLDTSALVRHHIDSLGSPKTFTVTTAHQPCLFTGPLYYIYKIFSTINLAEQLQTKYPAYHFVPVFINSAEDHDFEEVNHAHIFGKRLVWESGEQGPVGSMKCTSLKDVLTSLKEILGDSPNAAAFYTLVDEAYTSHDCYERATTHLVNALFKDYGLVVVEANHPDLKRLFVPFIQKEIFEQVSKSYIEKAAAQLEKAGFSGQAHAREINFFYLADQTRARIVFEDGIYKVLNTELTFSHEALNKLIEEHPERFSPNVIMRPLFQELILPNLAYIGGGGEIAYWLERKEQFQAFGLNFPMLVRRNSVLWIDKVSYQKMEKLGLNIQAMFKDTEAIIKQYIDNQATTSIHLDEEKTQLLNVFEQIKDKAEAIDPTLAPTVMAEHARQLKAIEQIEGRLIKSEKQRHETALNQIRNGREKLFPGNGLQERYDNVAGYYVKYGPKFFEVLKANLDPLEKSFLVMVEA